MRITYALAFIIFSILFFAFSCKRDNAVVDPCKNEEPFKVTLKISEIQGDSLIETDTVLINKTISFVAHTRYVNSASYEWKIGDMDTVTKTNEVRLFFPDKYVSPGELIKVRVVAKGPPNKICFPNESGVDTDEKNFRIIHWKDAPIIGRYAGFFGSDKEKKDRQIVEVRYNQPDSIFNYGRFDLFNINKGCNSIVTNSNLTYPYSVFDGGLPGARFMVFIGGSAIGGSFWNNCLAPSAILRLKGRDSLTVKFTYSKSILEVSNRISDSFKGLRIN